MNRFGNSEFDRLWTFLHAAAPSRRNGLKCSSEKLAASVLRELPTGKVLKQGSGTLVTKVLATNRQWVVKQYQLPRAKAALYQLVRRTPAWREWYGADRLEAAEISCSRPILLLHHGAECAAWQQTLIMPCVPGVPLSNWLRDQPPPAEWSAKYRMQRLAMAQQLGRQIGRMAISQLINRDHKPANLMVSESFLAGETPPVLIDTGSLRRRRNDAHLLQCVGRFFRIAQACGTITHRERIALLQSLLETDRSLLAGSDERFRLRYALQRISNGLGPPLPDPWRG